MRKIAILVAILAFSLFAATAIAAALPADTNAAQWCGMKTALTDQAAQACPGFIDEDGDGICDHRGLLRGGSTECPGYVDEDGDGVCDNREQAIEEGLACPGFIDENGVGVCDNRAVRSGGRAGNGYGRCGK